MLYYFSYRDNDTGKFGSLAYQTSVTEIGTGQLAEVLAKIRQEVQDPVIISWQEVAGTVERHSYPEHVLKILRKQEGLEPEDESRDAYFNSLSPDDVFGMVLTWEGIVGYKTSIKGFIRSIYSVTL